MYNMCNFWYMFKKYKNKNPRDFQVETIPRALPFSQRWLFLSDKHTHTHIHFSPACSLKKAHYKWTRFLSFSVSHDNVLQRACISRQNRVNSMIYPLDITWHQLPEFYMIMYLKMRCHVAFKCLLKILFYWFILFRGFCTINV